MTEPPKKWVVHLLGCRLCDSRWSENACKHTYETFKTIISLKIKFLHFSLKLQGWKVESSLEDRRIAEAFNLTSKEWSPHPKGENLLRQLYTCNGLQYGIQFLETWTSHWQSSSATPERREGETVHKMLQRKAWATTLSKTDPSWSNGQTSRHAKASSDKDFLSLLQLTLNTFKHVISQI
jgi:hypothetical protein